MIALADIPKQTFATMNGFPLAFLYDVAKKEEHRQEFIAYCDAEREKDQDVFIKLWAKALYCKDAVICDDVRVPNELEAMELLGVPVVRIKASLGTRYSLGMTANAAVDAHPTECSLDHLPDDYFAGVVENRGVVYYDEFVNDVLEIGRRLVISQKS